jgi:hypothetical protein
MPSLTFDLNEHQARQMSIKRARVSGVLFPTWVVCCRPSGAITVILPPNTDQMPETCFPYLSE